jgi:hypothetical protein
LTFCAALAAALVARQAPARPDRQTPTFRGGVTLVPLDVRVIDRRTRRPVTDLEAADFQVLENGVRQQIRHFQVQTLVPEPPPAGDDAISMRGARPGVSRPDAAPGPGAPTSTLAAPHNRLFLIVLGRGRLQHPSKGLDALAQFVRTRLLPQDLVAVYTYDRATDFTTNHERIGRIIDRFKEENDTIEWGI